MVLPTIVAVNNPIKRLDSTLQSLGLKQIMLKYAVKDIGTRVVKLVLNC